MFHLINACVEQPAKDIKQYATSIEASRCCGELTKVGWGRVLGRESLDQGLARLVRVLGLGFNVARAGGLVVQLRALGLGREGGGVPRGETKGERGLKERRYPFKICVFL